MSGPRAWGELGIQPLCYLADVSERPRWNFLDVMWIGGGTFLCLVFAANAGYEIGLITWFLAFLSYCAGRTVINTRRDD